MHTAAEQMVERLRLPVNATKARCPGNPGELLKSLENLIWRNCRPYSVADRHLCRASPRRSAAGSGRGCRRGSVC